MLLNIDLPKFDFPLVFSEHVSQPTSWTEDSMHHNSIVGHPLMRMYIPTIQQVYESKALASLSNFAGTATNNPTPSLQAIGTGNNTIITVEDPELIRENPVEAKHRRLVRSHRNGPLDRELKPNPKIRDELAVRTDFVIERTQVLLLFFTALDC